MTILRQEPETVEAAAAPLLALFARALAPLVAKELARIAPETRGDDLVDRRTAGISARLWDRITKSGELPVAKDGRRYVAKRSDVLRAIERRRVARRGGDADDAALAAAGVRIGGAR